MPMAGHQRMHREVVRFPCLGLRRWPGPVRQFLLRAPTECPRNGEQVGCCQPQWPFPKGCRRKQRPNRHLGSKRFPRSSIGLHLFAGPFSGSTIKMASSVGYIGRSLVGCIPPDIDDIGAWFGHVKGPNCNVFLNRIMVIG